MTNIKPQVREQWGTKIGVILAVAGSAVGLGNFLRFPVQAAKYGGAAFMIPYLISFLLFGIPLVWIEWTIGRYGGSFGHGSAPGVLSRLHDNRWMKYIGSIGLFGPLIIYAYYVWIESWLLGYTFFSITGHVGKAAQSSDTMGHFLGAYITPGGNYFAWAFLFFILTFIANSIVAFGGVQRGIERLNRYGMPILVTFAVVILIRVLFMGAPDPNHPEWSVINGLNFLWEPNFDRLLEAEVWMAAAGQMFFTLSVGIGCILSYASYISRKNDIVGSSLAAASTNEIFEVIIAGSIVIPLAFAFFGGAAGAKEIAEGGAFHLGFITMPLIFAKIPVGAFFSFLWFGLLFIAGLTSSISLIQPSLAFIQDEFGIDRKRAVGIVMAVTFIIAQPAIWLSGVLDDMDFWGIFCLVLFGTIEAVLFAWVFGVHRGWDEMHKGAAMKIPVFFKFIMKYITPVFLLIILGWYFVTDFLDRILLRVYAEDQVPNILMIRFVLIGVFLSILLLIHIAWERKKRLGLLGDPK